MIKQNLNNVYELESTYNLPLLIMIPAVQAMRPLSIDSFLRQVQRRGAVGAIYIVVVFWQIECPDYAVFEGETVFWGWHEGGVGPVGEEGVGIEGLV
jgi:hypothetical protein